MKNHNLSKHSILKASPLEVKTSKDLQFKTMIFHAEKYARVKRQKPQFNVGDIFRISRFHRSYNLQKLHERFVIHLVNTIIEIPPVQSQR